MQTREALWRRLSGEGLWPLAWALTVGCAVAWVVPETWDGLLPRHALPLGWLAVALTAPLIRSRRWALLPLAVVLAWGTLGGLSRLARQDGARLRGWVELEGTLAAPWSHQRDWTRGLLRVTAPPALRGQDLPLSFPTGDQPPPPPGTPVRVRAELQDVAPAPRFLAERPLWRARQWGTARRLHLPSAQVLEVLGPPRPSPVLWLQTRAWARFEALPLPPGPARDVWGALTLGIPPVFEEVTSLFAESGTLHTLVVSGLQVTLLLALGEALLRRLLGRAGSLAALGLSLLYVLTVGWSAPVWRGWLMGAAWALGRSTGWKLPPVATLHLALLAWFLAFPASGVDPGFLLAWWALLGILWGAEPLRGALAPFLGRLARPAALVLAPWATTLPLLALFHGGIPLWGPLANFLMVPLVGLLTPLCLALMLLPLPGAEGLGAVLGWTCEHLLPPLAHIRPMATGHLAPWIALALGWLWLAQRSARFQRTRALMALLAAASLGLLASRGTGRSATTLSLEAVDIGQGDALLVRAPGSEALLVDTGPNPWAARRLARVLSRRGVREPVRLVLTHPHGDHAGGWATLHRLWPLATVAGPAVADGDEDWGPWQPPAAAVPLPLRRGDHWTSGDLQASVRWPPLPFRLPDANMVSTVLRLRWRDRELWLMGDALEVQERDLLDLGEPEPGAFHRLLKVGHHGSRSSSTGPWIAALAPDAALIPAGRRNRFGHPHAETLETLRKVGLPEPWVVGPVLGVRVEATPGGWSWHTGLDTEDFTPFRTLPPPAAPR